MKCITDMETWLLGYGDRVYRYLVYRKVYTPYEEQQAFSDESQYEDSHYTTCRIEEAIDLGSGEWLLGLMELDEDLEDTGVVTYLKLSEIRLVRFEEDSHGHDR